MDKIEQSSNPLIRFLDDQTVETIQNIKEAEQKSLEESNKLKKTLVEAQIRIAELLNEL